MQNRAFSLVVFAAVLSGVSGLIVKYMEIPATSMAWIRMATPTLLIGLYLLWKGANLIRSGLKFMITASLFNVIRMWLFFITYIYTSISNAIIVLYTWPIFAVILSALLLKERVGRIRIILLLTSLTGVIIVYAGQNLSLQDDDFIGLTAGVLCAFFYACTVVIFKSQSNTYSPIETIFLQNLLGALIFFPFILINDPSPTNLDWTLGITHGILIGILMFSAFFYGLKYIKASTASMIAYIEVISAMSIGYFIMNDTLSRNMIIGAVLIVISTALLQRTRTYEN